MDPSQHLRAQELVRELEPFPPDQRQATLAAKAGVDPAVRAEVERLLAAPRDATSPESITVSLRMSFASSSANGGALIGRRVGPYELLEFLGRGGMGVVYLAEDKRLSRKAALKAVHPDRAQDTTLAERLKREARVLASLSHPNLATVYGLEESDGVLFMAMEFLQGPTLAERLGRNALPIPEALTCCEQIAAAVEAAHEVGIIHRDLKPENAMFAADGALKVLDFGLARELGASRADSGSGFQAITITEKGALVGTPAYMSPEQARGEPVDRRTDIFSLGTILYRCLTGRPAFEGATLGDVVRRILDDDPDWSRLPAELPSAVVSVVQRCLEKDPADRYRHMGDVRLDLKEALRLRHWERARGSRAHPRLPGLRISWALALCGWVAAAAAIWWAAARAPADTGAVQRFDLAFPDDAVQSDLERVQLALSPDGRNLVVAAKSGGGQGLWLRSHHDGKWERLAQSDAAHRPFFSPDGQWIAFFRNGHLYKRRTRGEGDPIHLAPATNWYGATWADDGALIYSAAWGDPLQRVGPGETEPRACTSLDPGHGEAAHLRPLAVPGAPFVLYNAWSGGERTDIHATDLRTGAGHVVVVNASTPRVASTPRGDHLLFERASIIFAVPFDRGAARVAGPESAIAEGVLNDGTRFAAYFDVAADGTLVYFPGTSYSEESRLSYVNADGSTEPVNADRLSFCEPSFISGSRKLGVLVKGKLYRSLIYDLERGTREFLLTGGDTLSFATSPDGRQLACTVNRDGGYGIDLYSLPQGTHLGRIVKPGADYPSDLGWSADGAFLIFSMSPKEGTPSDVWIIEPRPGAEPRTLAATPGADIKPSISPDGRLVAYSSDVTGRSEIYLVSCPDGRATRQLTFGGGAKPAWSPRGDKLYFVSPEGLASVAFAPDGAIAGKPRVEYARPFGQSDPIAREYTIAPDGRPLIVEPSERRPTVPHLKVITRWHRLLP